jgi:hypothetical protein
VSEKSAVRREGGVDDGLPQAEYIPGPPPVTDPILVQVKIVEIVEVGVLVLVAGGSTVAGALVSSMAAAANWGFGLASTALVGWAVTRLGILSPVERLLRFWRRR